MIKKASIVGFVLGLLLIFAPSISKAAVTPANLPFSFNGKLADLDPLLGFTSSGLEENYAAGPCYLKFDDQGDWLMLTLEDDPGYVSCMVHAYNCGGGNEFDIQYSTDGINFVTFHTCSNLYTTIDTVSVDLSLISDISYIRWKYTTKNTGNYGLGAIKISKRGDVFTYIVDSDSAVIGSEHVFPKLINSYNKAVTYSSSAPDIATVDEAGNITLVAPGTTTITAQTTTDDGQKLSASYLLVVRKPTNTITFDSPAGTYVAAPVSVSLSASADGTTFYYTTDGSDPTTESPLYTEAIEVTHSGTELKVLALNNETEDAMVSATYVIQPEKPLFDKEAQRFVKTLDVGLSLPESTPSTSKIYYAINEQADATKTLYEGTPVTLAGSSASQKIALHAVVVDEFGNVGVENSVEYTHETAVYKKVTSQEEIVDGGEYLVVCEDYNVAMSDYNSSTHFMDQYGIIIDKTNNTIITSKDLAVTLVKRSSGYGIRYDATNYIAWQTKQSKDTYFYKSSSSVSTDGNTQWTISVLPDGNVEIRNVTKNSRYIKYNGSTDFRAYTSDYGNPVQLYKKVTVPSSLTLRAKGDDSNYYATFSSTKDVVFDNDVTVSTVSVVDGALQIKPLEKGTYSINALDKSKVEDGYYVPANTGVLLTSPTTNTTCYVPFTKKSVTVDASNLLVAVSESGMFTGKDGYKYFKLAYDDSDNHTGLGFFWGAADGAPFNVVAGLAYLAVPDAVVANAKSGFLLYAPTGVEVVRVPEADGKIYTLSGQRVDKISGRGVYIINGKKVVRK